MSLFLLSKTKCLESKPFSIKPQQFEAISYIIAELDTLYILPTGFGKSLIYQPLPSIFKKLGNEKPQHPVVVVLVRISCLKIYLKDL